jgi:glucose-1-phosphate thymidylyltransferase
MFPTSSRSMNVVILAAGFATHLYPLTLTQPKPLLPVAGRPMINYVLDNLAPIPGIDRAYIVTNAKFAGHFQAWADQRRQVQPGLELVVVNDGSTDDANSLGAIGDLRLVLEQAKLDDDLIVVAGDNLFSKPLTEFGAYCRQCDGPVLGVTDAGSLDQAKKYGVVAVDKAGRLIGFVEKPANPASTLIGIALYYFPKATLPLIHQYLAEGNNPDQPGRLIQWMYPRLPVHTWSVPGIWYDIGSKETLAEANRIFAAR